VRAKEMRERSEEELLKMLDDTKNALFKLRIKNATHQLDNTGDIKRNRREVARIMTVLGERNGNSGAEAKDEG
jgi:large subunit ribosomal protein L29